MNGTRQPNTAAEFVRHLNVLLKSVRLYGMNHTRIAAQSGKAWQSLSALLAKNKDEGFLLAVSGHQLLADGAALETTNTERSIADLFSAAGLSSVQFTSRVTQEDFERFLRGFAAAGGKTATLLEDLKAALGESANAAIRVNKIRFVAEDADHPQTVVASTVVAEMVSPEAGKLKDWLGDPQRMLQLIAAAEGAQKQASGQTGETQPAPAAAPTPPRDEDIFGVLRMFGQMAKGGAQPTASAGDLTQQLASLPPGSQALLQQAVASLAAGKLPTEQPQGHLLVRIAEQLAIRHALERFQSGEDRVDTVRETLGRMAREVEGLRKMLSAHEEKMTRAGMSVESYAEMLDRQFWTQVPDASKQNILLSPEAWCIPPRNIASFLEQCQTKGEPQIAQDVLRNYATRVRSPEADSRRKTAQGIADLAKHYASAGEEVLGFAISQVGRQASSEPAGEIQHFLGEAFVRLSQEAAAQRRYGAVEQVVQQLANIEDRQAPLAQSLRPRIGVEIRMQDFLEDALKAAQIPAGLAALLQRVPQVAAEQILARFNRSSRREECQRLLETLKLAGPQGVAHLRETLERGSDPIAVGTVGLLSRLEPGAVAQMVPARMQKWDRQQQDQLLRQLAFGGSPERGLLLANCFSRFDPLLRPEVVDEIGMCGDRQVSPWLLQLASGETAQFNSPYLRLKAIEALGRLREPRASALLRQIVGAKRLLGWEHPHELRLVAAQALMKIDPAWGQKDLAASGLSAKDLNLAPPLDPQESQSWARSRRYPRMMLAVALPAVINTEKKKSNLAVKVVNLGGGLATSDIPIAGGTTGSLEFRGGFRNVHAEVLVRETRHGALTFEVVWMDFDERFKLRKLLATLQSAAV